VKGPEKSRVVILQKRVVGLSEAALERFVTRARRGAGLRGSVNVLVTNSTVVRALNRRFRRKDKATDVLSFPTQVPSKDPRERASLAGDVAISADIAAKNASRLGHSAAVEIKILTLHGILHLAGFDHERDNGEMARKEARLRAELGLPLALIERMQARPQPARTVSPKRRRAV
jgi:probable rRNA maturation factor